MSEPTPETVQQPAEEPNAGQQPEQPTEAETPPWGDDFDPAKAWEKIQKANREAANLRQRAISPEQQKQLEEYNALVEASKTDAQRREEAQQAAERRASQAETEAVRYKIALRHGITEDDFDLLGSGTEEEVEARATKIAAKNEAGRQAALEAAVQPQSETATPAPRRPVTQLRPGASPSPDPVQDDTYYPASWLSPSQRSAIERSQNS